MGRSFWGGSGGSEGSLGLGFRPAGWAGRRFPCPARRLEDRRAECFLLGFSAPRRVRAMPDYLMGEFNGGCTTADGCREQPLLAAILQEANARAQPPPSRSATPIIIYDRGTSRPAVGCSASLAGNSGRGH